MSPLPGFGHQQGQGQQQEGQQSAADLQAVITVTGLAQGWVICCNSPYDA